MVDAKNAGDNLAYQTEKNLAENGDKIDADTKGKIEAALNRLKEANKTDNLEEIRSATEALNQVWSQASSNMYSQAGGAPEGQAAGNAPQGESVEEADFEVVDDDQGKKDA